MRFFILPVLLVLVGCGSGEKKASAGESGATVGSPGESAEFDPAETIVPASPPAPPPENVSMPGFAPQYPGSTIRAAVHSSHGGDQTHEVTLWTKDDAAKIVAFYREAFAAAGLEKKSEFLSGGTGMMSGASKGRKASVAITRQGDHNAVIVTYSGG